MKFTKEQAIEKIKANYASKGEKTDLERTIKEHVESLCSILGDESDVELDDFVSKVTPFVETALGLSRKIGSDAVKAYKEAHPEKKVPEPEKKEEHTEDEQSELEKRLAALEAKLKESESQEKIKVVKNSLIEKLREKGVKNDEWSKSIIEEVSISEDTDVDAKADSLLKLYNKSRSASSPSFTPASPSEGEQNKNPLSDVAEFMKNNSISV